MITIKTKTFPKDFKYSLGDKIKNFYNKYGVRFNSQITKVTK